MSDDINWAAIESLYPEQVARDPMEWRFLIYDRIKDHEDACYLEFLARHSREIIDILVAHQRAEQEQPGGEG